jgi:hypothetical protein
MKKDLQQIAFMSLIAAIIFFACKKNDHVQNTLPGQGTGSVTGIITDLNNSPVSNAAVVGGTASTTTDPNGKFTLTKVQFTADTVLLNVTKDGFFEGSKNFASSNNSVTDAAIQLIAKPVSVSISASSGGNVSVAGGGSVNFSSGFVNASNGNPYTGNVSVSTSYLNPTAQNFSTYVPGNLKAASISNQQGVLQSFGVAVVEMSDASGNKLQLASGKTATITLPIPSALQAMAPSSIPLWYFDDAKGAWRQEGTATKQGSNYVGTVKHFSFWNAGDLAGPVNLTAIFLDSLKGTAFINKLVTITRVDSTSTNGMTDNNGTVSGLVPVNEVLVMKAFDSCGAVVYSKNIGPFSQDTVLGKINIIDSNCKTSVDTTQYINLTLGWQQEDYYSWNYSSIKENKSDTSGLFVIGINGGSPNNTTDSATYFGGDILYSDTVSFPAPGNYVFQLYAIINGGNLHYTTFSSVYPQNQTISKVTQFDAVGGYIIGTSSGFLYNYLNSTDSLPFSCSYRIKRTQ